MKNNFLSNISHKLRSQLSVIKGFVDLISEEKSGPLTPLQKKQLDITRKNIDSLIALFERLFNFSKMEFHLEEFNINEFDIVALAKKSIAAIKPKANNKKISIKENFSSDSIFIKADQEKLTQVFNNLLDNAVKFTPSEGTVILKIENNENKIIILSIIDTGIGIHEKVINKIFDRFYQADSSGEGIGIGLTICKDIIIMHKGEITVESIPGKGSTFTFTIPKQ